MEEPGGGVHVVVSGVLRRGGEVLLGHRTADRDWYPAVWDLFGGHVEQGETPRAALLREMHEELGIAVDVPAESVARVQGPDLLNEIFLLDTWAGEPTNLAADEHDEIRWFTLEEVRHVTLADPRILQLLAALLG